MTDYLADIKKFHTSFIEPYNGKPVGASQEEIEALEKKVGFRLPLAYKQYLEWMGRDYQGPFVGMGWFITEARYNEPYVGELLRENSIIYTLPEHYLSFYDHQGYQSAWFSLPVENEDPPIYYYIEGKNRYPFLWGRFSDFLMWHLRHSAAIYSRGSSRGIYTLQNPTSITVLITGGAGLLGQHLIKYHPHHATVTATQRTTPVTNAVSITADLTDARAVQRTFDNVRPELVFHTAYTMNSERDIVEATKNVAEACRATGAELIYLSTDALFDGRHAPYAESASPTPMTHYGRWKAQAEEYVMQYLPSAAIVRTSLLTQFNPLDPRSAWVANSLRNKEPITLFVDELRCPILVDDLARQLWELTMLPTSERNGVWHLVGAEAVSRYTLGLLIAQHEGLDASGITTAHTNELTRPRDLRLLTTRADKILPTHARSISRALLDTRKLWI